MFEIILFLILFRRHYKLNERYDGILKNEYDNNNIKIESNRESFSFNPKVKKEEIIKHENCLNPSSEHKWCSKHDINKPGKPWIRIIFKNNTRILLKGYSIKFGCCNKDACCCKIFSWLLEGSNDNFIWTKLHVIEKNDEFIKCGERTFEIFNFEFYKYFRIRDSDFYQKCATCISILKLEFYGDVEDD